MESCFVTTVIGLLCCVTCHARSTPVTKFRDSCALYKEDGNPIKFHNPENCGVFFQCNSTGTATVIQCDYGDWFDHESKMCKDIDGFPKGYQHKCFKKMGAPGSTPNLKDVFLGRCFEYQKFRHPEFFVDGREVDCKELYNTFTEAFQHKYPCGQVKFGAYNDFLEATNLELLPKDKLLFWSSIKDFSQQYANRGHRLFTLEETFLGYLVDDLTWCGKNKGIDFVTCPPWGICDHHPMVTFWEEASQQFAKMAVDTITLMLNGSMPGRSAFRSRSFFAEHELPSLTDKINEVRVWVAHALEIPVQETCAQGSLIDLQKLLGDRGFDFNCQDNPQEILNLLCVDNPLHSDCPKQA